MPFAQYSGSSFSRKRPKNQEDGLTGVSRSIENARTRIQDSGYNPGDSDSRNWFEKWANLPEGQNFFFDALELLDRPANAIRNVLSQSPDSRQSVGQAFARGFAGRDKVRGSEIVEKAGITNPVAKAVVGTAAEIGLDPLTYIPGGMIAKGIRSTAAPVGRGFANAYKSIEPQAMRNVREQTIQPAMERAKDALGRGFVPDYKLGEDLYGRADDTILRSKQQTENQMRFMNENVMRNIADEAKKAGGIETGVDVGRIMESPLKQFDEAGNEIFRPQREMSSNPAINEAARNLLRSNKELRQWALDNGVQIGELEGYMTHVLSAEERKRRKNLKALPLDRGNFGTGQPNKSILKERTLKGSAEDVNEQLGRNFFEPNAFFATAVGQKRLIDYVNAAKFRREVLSNPNFAVKYEKGMEIPNNAVVVDSNNYKFIDDDSAKSLGLQSEIGGEYVVTKAVKQALDRYKKLTTDEGINAFIKAFDAAQSFWKRTTLFSVPYHIRNAVGAMFNNYVGGMNTVDLSKYTKEGYQDVYKAIINGKETPLFKEFREQGLGSTSLSGVEFARRGIEPEDAITKTVEKRSQFDGTLGGRAKAELKSLKNPLNAFETSRDFGDFIDQTNRFALYKWARNKGMSPEQAAQKVREVQFDYSRTTPFEREVAVRLVPFYRWMRNNLPFQLRQFINDPRKYANVNKLRLNATEAVGIEDEDVPDWMREQFAIPVYGDRDRAYALGFNLPVGDLARLNDPLKMLMESITPAAKLPAELALNRNFFYDRPIQEFSGQQRQLAIPDNIFGIPIPGGGTEFPSALEPNETLAYILEQIGGQPARQTLNLFADPQGEDQRKKFLDPVLGIGSLYREVNPEQSRYFQQMDELKRLQDLMNYIEQQTGSKPRSINEINSSR